MPYVITHLDTRHAGWSNFHVATIRTPDGEEIRREIEDHGTAVAVLPYDPDRKVATLVRQFRPPVFHIDGREDFLEVPAGLLEGPDPEVCARREADEEVGLALGDLERVAMSWTMPGISTERIHLFLAAYGPQDRTGRGGGIASEHERITIGELPLGELARMADDGRLEDMKTFLLVQTLRIRRADLFGA